MAISKLKPRHASEGRSIAAVLAERIDYSKNPEEKGKHYAEWSAEKKSQI